MNKISDREKIFAIIRKQLLHSQKYKFSDDYQSPLKFTLPDTVDGMILKFKLELEALGGKADHFISINELQQAILPNLKENLFFFISDHIMTKYPELVNQIKKSSRIFTETDLSLLASKRDLYNETISTINVALTDCLCAIAETGTIIFSGSFRLPLAMAPQLMAIITPDQILKSLDNFFTNPEYKEHKNSNLFFITGPSQTADIEKQLVRGVHGPKDVFAFFIDK